MTSASLRDHLPLKPAVLAMLTELAETPLHGYALMTRLEYLRGGRGIGPASLYRTLDQLEREGLIGALPSDPGESRRGPAYQLTEAGRQILKAEVERIEALAGRARAALGADG